MRKTLLAITLLAVIGLHAQEAQAQVRFGAQASFGDDVDFGLGARAVFSLKQFNERLEGIASFDWFFPDSGVGVDWTYFEINGNVVYSIPLSSSSSLRPYAGGGLNIARSSIDFDTPLLSSASDTEIGLNVLGGTKFGSGRLTPFAELRIELGGGEQFVISGGFLF